MLCRQEVVAFAGLAGYTDTGHQGQRIGDVPLHGEVVHEIEVIFIVGYIQLSIVERVFVESRKVSGRILIE